MNTLRSTGRAIVVALVLVGLAACAKPRGAAGPARSAPSAAADTATAPSTAGAATAEPPAGESWAAPLASGAVWVGRVVVQDSHCGGAMLSPEMAARLTRPAGNRRFVVLGGERNTAAPPVATFATDAQGGFRLAALRPATYCVVEASRQVAAADEKRILALPPASAPVRPVDTTSSDAVDPECVKRLPLRCDAVWQTATPGFAAEVYLPGTLCPWTRPCSTYQGPLPP